MANLHVVFSPNLQVHVFSQWANNLFLMIHIQIYFPDFSQGQKKYMTEISLLLFYYLLKLFPLHTYSISSIKYHTLYLSTLY